LAAIAAVAGIAAATETVGTGTMRHAEVATIALAAESNWQP